MIGPDDVCGIVVTRGDVNLTQVLTPLEPLGDVVLWNNALDEDLAVYGRYAAIEHTDKPVILVVDDDVALSPEAVEGLLAAYEPGKIVANMPPEYRQRYTDSCLVGFGAIFNAELPIAAFERFLGRSLPLKAGVHRFGLIGPPRPSSIEGFEDRWAVDEMFLRTCDVIFTTLTPFTLVDLPFDYLPWTRAANRMYRDKKLLAERQQMLVLTRKVRDALAIA